MRELGLQHFQFDDHVTEKLAFGRVGKRTVVSELVNLADVVQERASEKKIAIDLGIVAAHQVAGAKERDDVIEQPADVGVMQGLGGGCIAIGGGNFRIGHEGLDQRFQMGIPKRSDKAGQGLPEFVDVLRGLGKVVGEVDLGFAQLAQLVNRELEAILVLVDEALDF